MFRVTGLVMLVAVTSALGSLRAIAAGASLPDPTSCVWYDQIICSYEIVDRAALADGESFTLTPIAGLPAVERIELRRVDADRVVVYIFYPPRRDAQGVAQ